MQKRKGFCPAWSWWVRSGERLTLGLDLREVLDPAPRLSQRERDGLRKVLSILGRGTTVVQAMRESGLQLPLEAWTLLETGELTGHLGEAMRDIGMHLQDRSIKRRQLLGQIWYPSMVLIAGMGVMGLILLWVIPQMQAVSTGMGGPAGLPWLTEHIGLLYGSLFAAALLLLAGGAVLLFSLHWLAGRYPLCGQLEERVYNLLPLVGSIRRQTREARLLRQVGTLLRGGVTLPASLTMAAGGCVNLWEKHQLLLFRERLLRGTGLAVAAASCALLSADNEPLLEAGQESGNLETYMVRIADDLQVQASWKSQQLTRVLEPVFLLGLSAAIAGLILAYLLPMVRMLEQAGGSF